VTFGDYRMKLYSGRFNWHGELHNLHTKAKSRKKALHNFLVQLSKKLERSKSSLAFYFLDEGIRNWEIREGYFDEYE